MTKFIYLLAMMFTLNCFNTNAQEDKREGNGKKIDRTEMMKKRVDRMAERYGLDEKQAQQLLELNTKYEGKMMPNGMRPRMRRGNNANGQGNDAPSVAERPSKEQMEAMREEMKKNREEYDAALKQIMTSEQYAKYEQDRKDMMSKRNNANGRGGMRRDR